AWAFHTRPAWTSAKLVALGKALFWASPTLMYWVAQAGAAIDMTTAAGAVHLSHSVIMSPHLDVGIVPKARRGPMTSAALLQQSSIKTIRDFKRATRDASPTTSSAPSAIANYFQVRFGWRRVTEPESGSS